jgi:hypothetical protein
VRVSKPSPAMIVALIALVFSMTGTGIAAKSLITGKQIKDRSITAKDIANGAITQKKLAKGAVARANLAARSVTSAALAPNAITSAALAPNAITSAAVAPNAITSAALAPNAVTEQALAANSVSAPAIRDGAVTRSALNYATICPNGVLVVAGESCPYLPYSVAETEPNLPLTQPLLIGCYGQQGAPAPINFAWDAQRGDSPGKPATDSFDVVNHPSRLTIMAGQGGPTERKRVDITATATFAPNASATGSYVIATIVRYDGSTEQVPNGAVFVANPGSGQATTVTVSAQGSISPADWVQFALCSKGAPGELTSMTARVRPVNP